MNTFRQNVFVREDFLSTVKAENLLCQLPFGGTQGEAYSSWDFRDIENLKLSLHLVNIKAYKIILFVKLYWIINFRDFFEMRVFYANKLKMFYKKKNVPISRFAEIFLYAQFFISFSLHNKHSPMPVGLKLWEE